MSGPVVELSWDQWCPLHLEPLRAEWPRGATFAMLGLFNAAVADERIMAEAEGDTGRLAAVLEAHRPLCCYLGDLVMLLVVGMAKERQVYGR